MEDVPFQKSCCWPDCLNYNVFQENDDIIQLEFEHCFHRECFENSMESSSTNIELMCPTCFPNTADKEIPDVNIPMKGTELPNHSDLQSLPDQLGNEKTSQLKKMVFIFILSRKEVNF
jgi:hypothetical protein